MEHASIWWRHHETTKDSHEKHNTCWSLSRQLNSYCIILLSYYDSFEYIFTCTNICIPNLVIRFFTIMFTSFLIPQQNCPFHKCIFDKPMAHWCAILIAHQIVMAKHGGSCVHFSGISTCGRTSRETVSHPQCPPLPTLCKISLPIYVIVTNILLQPLTTTWYDSLVLSISLLKI